MGTRNRVNQGVKALAEIKSDWRTYVQPEHIKEPIDILVQVFGSKHEAFRLLSASSVRLRRLGFVPFSKEQESPNAHVAESASLLTRWQQHIEQA